jgi:hypothetical protein
LREPPLRVAVDDAFTGLEHEVAMPAAVDRLLCPPAIDDAPFSRSAATPGGLTRLGVPSACLDGAAAARSVARGTQCACSGIRDQRQIPQPS